MPMQNQMKQEPHQDDAIYSKIRQTQKQALLLEEEQARLEQELDQKYYQLGREIYEAADRGVSEINALVDRLVETKLKLCKIREHRVCPYCLSQSPMEDQYCGKCGRRLDEE